MEQQLANLPTPALVTFGVVLAIIFAVRYFGLWQGQQHSPAASASSAQVAAVIVDPTALNKATAAVEDLVEALNDAKAKEADHAHMICRRVEVLAAEVDSLSRAVSALMLEMARKH